MRMRFESVIGLCLSCAAALVFACGNQPDPETPTPGTHNSKVDACVTEEAWTTTAFYHEEENARGNIKPILHIYEYHYGLWCGFHKYEFTDLEYLDCDEDPCEWKAVPNIVGGQDQEHYALAWGSIEVDGDTATIYGWTFTDGDMWDQPPTSPGVAPGETDPASEDLYFWTGQFDIAGSTPTCALYDNWNMLPLTLEVGENFTVDFDLPSKDLTSTTMVLEDGTDVEDWCDGWVNSPSARMISPKSAGVSSSPRPFTLRPHR